MRLGGHSQTSFTRGGGVGSPKMSIFVNVHRGVDGQKSQKLVNVVYERPLISALDLS